MGAERGEFVGIRGEGKAGQFGDSFGGALAELGVRVQAGSHGGSADGEGHYAGQRHVNAGQIGVEECDVSGKFLSEGDRCGVL